MDDEPRKCFHCNNDYELKIADFVVELPGGEDRFTLNDLEALVCSGCGDEVIPPKSQEIVEAAIVKRIEDLSWKLDKIRKIREDLIRQKEMGFLARNKFSLIMFVISGALLASLFEDPLTYIAIYIVWTAWLTAIIFWMDKRVGLE